MLFTSNKYLDCILNGFLFIIYLLAFAFIFTFSIGLTYIIDGNVFSGSFEGILTKVVANDDFHCNNYCIDEYFQKVNTTNSFTCIVTRLSQYSSEAGANNAIFDKTLYTTKKVYITYRDSGVCIDDTIKDYYNRVGWTLFILSMIPIVCYIIKLFFAIIKIQRMDTRNIIHVPNATAVTNYIEISTVSSHKSDDPISLL